MTKTTKCAREYIAYQIPPYLNLYSSRVSIETKPTLTINLRGSQTVQGKWTISTSSSHHLNNKHKRQSKQEMRLTIISQPSTPYSSQWPTRKPHYRFTSYVAFAKRLILNTQSKTLILPRRPFGVFTKPLIFFFLDGTHKNILTSLKSHIAKA